MTRSGVEYKKRMSAVDKTYPKISAWTPVSTNSFEVYVSILCLSSQKPTVLRGKHLKDFMKYANLKSQVTWNIEKQIPLLQ
jgi:hypothetical protein